MNIKSKAMLLCVQADEQETKFRVAIQEKLLSHLLQLQNDAVGNEGAEINELVWFVKESIAKTKAHKQMCDLLVGIGAILDDGKPGDSLALMGPRPQQ